FAAPTGRTWATRVLLILIASSWGVAVCCRNRDKSLLRDYSDAGRSARDVLCVLVSRCNSGTRLEHRQRQASGLRDLMRNKVASEREVILGIAQQTGTVTETTPPRHVRTRPPSGTETTRGPYSDHVRFDSKR